MSRRSACIVSVCHCLSNVLFAPPSSMLPVHRTDHGLKLADSRPAWAFSWLLMALAGCLLVFHYFLLNDWDTRSRSKTDLADVNLPQSPTLDPHLLPPTFFEYHEAELRLPQHHWSRTHPASGEKFFFVAGHVRGLGWGNALQEHLLNAHLAYVSDRSFVFGNYTWNDDGSVFTYYDGKPIPSQIPYTALIQGPSVGGAFPPGSSAPRAVSQEYFEQICQEKFEINRSDVHDPLVNLSSAREVTDRWSALLRSMDHPCVQSSLASAQVYSHHYIFGRRGALADLWPFLAVSPIITHFGWSELIESAFDTNQALFLSPSAPASNLTRLPFTTNRERYTLIPGLMAIHVRRGDYLKHCTDLTNQLEDFVSVNTLPGLPDPFVAPRGFFFGELTRADRELYRRRCYPSVEEIVRKVEEVRATPDGRGLRRIYIMTNGKQDFIDELKGALREAGEWDLISSSRDMVLTREQQYVAQAMDMLVAQRAQVFIGNGFSTLTSGAVMMRLANKFATSSTRFW
ncbi:hypothetical protein BD414DRAFT_492453 [Trametes punicea]|nr:hypothetical protein BD414DRAFT_492453 [Trametes punicea]